MIVRFVENCSKVEVISTITESQCNPGTQREGETNRQTDMQYTESTGPMDQRSENQFKYQQLDNFTLKNTRMVSQHNKQQLVTASASQ